MAVSKNPRGAWQSSISVCIILLAGSILLSCSRAHDPESTNSSAGTASLQATKANCRINLEAYLPRGLTEFDLRITSDRNHHMTRVSVVSPHDPDSIRRRERFSSTDVEIWYPVVDVVPEQGMHAVCRFRGDPEGWYVFGGPYFRDTSRLRGTITIPSYKLERWENSLMVNSRSHEVETFYLQKRYPVILREFRHTIQLLSPDWSGKISLHSPDPENPEILAEISIDGSTRRVAEETEALKGTGISRERLISALKLLIADGQNRQNLDPASPMYGSLFLFYDLDGRLHRTPYWTWGGSHYVKMVLDAIKLPEIETGCNTTELLQSVSLIGDLYLKYQVHEPEHPSRGSYLVIWSRNYRGYTKWVGTSDSGVIVRWALVPLFRATGDSAYLESAVKWCEYKGRMLDTVAILPHYYKYDAHEFASGILDETGWDPEGHAALYEITGNDRYRESAREFMEKHMKVFQREDGLWRRRHNWRTGDTQETAKMVRGLGWAMEGLLAMNRMYPDTIYLEYAERLAGQLMSHQHPDGSWSFVFDLPKQAMGITEKGTALWSLLFYQLYAATGSAGYLETARKALLWCLENQYTGPDPEAIGGLVGRTNASMVGIRHYYDATCAYATSFFGLAILEEINLIQDAAKQTAQAFPADE